MGLIVIGIGSINGDVGDLFLDTDVVIDLSSPSGTVAMLSADKYVYREWP
ncbi:MAG: hypothetical protein LBI20_03345 [Holosporales bacterium]|jgi:hypothetical protein|nr:hypothetical protein [Holosporales bacterium]